eukprot:1145313-Lingulodinium_polyedra.AAC.1
MREAIVCAVADALALREVARPADAADRLAVDAARNMEVALEAGGTMRGGIDAASAGALPPAP